MEDLSAWFPKEKVAPFPFDRTFEQAEWDPLCVLHTSGSTGLPKPIPVIQVSLSSHLGNIRHAGQNALVADREAS